MPTLEAAMTLPLTQEQQREVRAAVTEPLRLVDPETQRRYVVLPEDMYERMQSLVNSDDFSPDEKLRLLAESGGRAGWHDPRMDDYVNYDEAKKKLCP